MNKKSILVGVLSLGALTFGTTAQAFELGSNAANEVLEASCGGKTKDTKTSDAKCGEGKCGDKKTETKATDAKCGEGKCGGKKADKKADKKTDKKKKKENK